MSAEPVTPEVSSATATTPPFERKETFLAHYPRTWKLLAAAALVAVLFGFWAFPKKQDPSSANVAEYASTAASEREVAGSSLSQQSKRQAVDKPRERDATAIAINDTDDRDTRMLHAPDPALTEETIEGALPRIGDNGRKVWQAYARPFNVNDTRPRVAIVIIDMGLSRIASDTALRRLPSSVTMAFDAQSPFVASWLNRARQEGHETLLSVPMEPFDYPRSDPGPNTLLTNLPNTNLTQRLYWALRQGTGYIGITTLSGSRFTTDVAKMRVVLDVLKQRGLMVFDARVAPRSVLKDIAQQAQVPVAVSTLFLDKDPSPAAIDGALNQLEQTAHLEGHAIGIAAPLPVTLDRLEAWIKVLPSHGLALAPVSAVVE